MGQGGQGGQGRIRRGGPDVQREAEAGSRRFTSPFLTTLSVSFRWIQRGQQFELSARVSQPNESTLRVVQGAFGGLQANMAQDQVSYYIGPSEASLHLMEQVE